MKEQRSAPARRPTDPSGKHRVLVVDDHPIVRQGLTLLIDREPDLMVCGQAEEAHSAAHAIATLRPDIVLLDISLNGPDGLELLKQIRTRDADLPVLILSMHDETIYAERVLRAGANGYIMVHSLSSASSLAGGARRSSVNCAVAVSRPSTST